jgi:glycosyltransferase involved in cell wall biosynthesis
MTPLRMAYFAKYLSLSGHSVDVLTTDPSYSGRLFSLDKSKMNLIPPEVKIFRVPTGLLHKLRTKSEETSKYGTNLIEKLIRNLLVPDGRIDWLPYAFNKGRLLFKKYKYDLIVSSAFPFTSHLIAYLLKRKFNSFWIADYGDPWAFNPDTVDLFFWRKVLDKKIETHLLKYMDKVILSTKETAEKYINFYSFLDKNTTSVITNGYDDKEYSSIPAESTDKFRIVYTGIMYGKFREPYSFFDALKSMQDKDVEVLIVGKVAQSYRAYVKEKRLESIVSFLGYKSHNEVIRLQKGASLLILFGWPKGYQIPAKLFEYFGASRPILGIRYDEKDPAAKLIENYKRGKVVNNEASAIASALNNFYSLWKSRKLESEFNLEKLHEYSWSCLSKKMEKVVLTVLKEKK